MISYEEYNNCLNLFISKEIAANNSNIWTSVGDKENIYYVKKETRSKADLCTELQPKDPHVDSSNLLMQFLEEDLESDIDSASISKSFWSFEYHIVYSLAYSVPVLYFNAWDETGMSLTYDELWKFLEFNSIDKWEVVSQNHHPVLGSAFYYFHPCKTADVMQVIKKDTSDNWQHFYIATWLNIYGKNIGLTVPSEYFLSKIND